MKNKCLIETIVTLLHDNVINVFIILIANHHYNVSLVVSLKLWFLAQVLNFLFSYKRRKLFEKYAD